MNPPILWEALLRYLEAYQCPEETKAAVQGFVRWYGQERPVSDLRGPDVARYVEGLGLGEEAQRRAQALRQFLSFLQEEGWVSYNLAKYVRLRRGIASTPSYSPVTETVTMTPEGYAALQAELESLKAQRPLIAEEIRRAALDKDFRENAPLQAAREKQAHLETRIRELETLLKRAVVATNQDSARISLGSTVHVRRLDDGQALRFTIVGPGEANPKEGRISSASPIGQALLDRTVGEEVEIEVPAGRLRLRIEQIE